MNTCTYSHTNHIYLDCHIWFWNRDSAAANESSINILWKILLLVVIVRRIILNFKNCIQDWIWGSSTGDYSPTKGLKKRKKKIGYSQIIQVHHHNRIIFYRHPPTNKWNPSSIHVYNWIPNFEEIKSQKKKNYDKSEGIFYFFWGKTKWEN